MRLVSGSGVGADLVMQTFAAVGATDVIYVAGPVTSGRREIEEIEATGLSRAALRELHSHRFQLSVVGPNKRELRELVAAARVRHPDRIVVDPTIFHVDGWMQRDYLDVCLRIVRELATSVLVGRGWEFSTGAAAEVELALALGVPVVTHDWSVAVADELVLRRERALSSLLARGWDSNHAAAYLGDSLLSAA